ncbi:hypothetical protein PG997_014896 [Apiospora hydei]|uniref:Ankyrin repeat protein n=1 Tax=Apiospora hydei TaxID=1337664 RepID=A0ABR1UV37_9PEZI
MVFTNACQGNHLSTLEMVLEPREEGDTKWDENFVKNMWHVTDVEVFKRLYSSAKGFLHVEELRDEFRQPRYWPTTVLPDFLCHAAGQGAIPLMEFLMELGAVPEKEHTWTPEERDTWSDPPRERSPLRNAACFRRGNAKAVIYLMEKGFPPRDHLTEAVKHGGQQTVEALLSYLDKESPLLPGILEEGLKVAVRTENEPFMRRLLEGFGSTIISNEAIERQRRDAQSMGLDSMAEHLRRYLNTEDLGHSLPRPE